MAIPKVLVLVLAGGQGGRLELLTETRAKPAVPFAGVYRLIDFPLSNCQHSSIADVWVSIQFHPTSLADHLANGRPWDLDRTTGGLMTLPPYQGDERGGWNEGTADSLWRHAELIRGFGADALVVVSADAVYELDYWRDVGTVPAYWQAHQDFLDAEPPIDLDSPDWPLHTRGGRHSAARVLR